MTDFTEYQQDALRVENTDIVACAKRMQAFYKTTFLVLKDLQTLCGEAGQLKKYLFYGDTTNYSHAAAQIKGPPLPTPDRVRITHAILGLADELGELCEALLEKGNFPEEFGDTLWYTALGCSAIGADMGEVADANIRKLKIRFPDGFTEEDAINRSYENESAAFEQLDLPFPPEESDENG